MATQDVTSNIARPALTVGMVETLPDLVRRAMALVNGSQTALAKQLEISPSRISRILKGDYSFEVVYCLRLAKLLHLPIPDVLRAAGKHQEAALLDDVCHRTAAPPQVDPDLGLLDPDQQDVVHRLVQVMLQGKRRTRDSPRPRATPAKKSLGKR